MKGKFRVAFTVVVAATVLTAIVNTFASMSGIPLTDDELALTAGVSILFAYAGLKTYRKIVRRPKQRETENEKSGE